MYYGAGRAALILEESRWFLRSAAIIWRSR